MRWPSSQFLQKRKTRVVEFIVFVWRRKRKDSQVWRDWKKEWHDEHEQRFFLSVHCAAKFSGIRVYDLSIIQPLSTAHCGIGLVDRVLGRDDWR
jgi:hypothetical protein